MRKHLLLVSFLFSSLFLTAQGYLIISGKVEADASEDFQIHVINITQKTGTLTSEDGNFQIRVKVNDTLVFSSLVYVPKKVIISSEDIGEGFLLVSLEKEVNELEEVKISDLNLSGNLNADLNSIEVIDKFDLGIPISKKPPPTQAQRRVDVTPISPILGGVAFNFEHLLNLASGRHKRNLLIKKNEDISFLIQKIRNLYPEEIFTEEIGVETRDINGFLYFCVETADLEQHVRSKNKLELLEFLKKWAPEFYASRKVE